MIESDLAEGQTYYTTRGIVEIQDFYMEDDLHKVRVRLHTVDESDGVTPIGGSLLMSTTPQILCGWINRFKRDIEERQRYSTHDAQIRIKHALAHGPKLKKEK